jgi:hypothetical protein
MKKVERYEDMSRLGKLVVLQQNDGDMIVSIIPDPEEPKHLIQSAEFCTLTGGGQSLNTRKALQNLMEAMEKDNREKPQER